CCTLTAARTSTPYSWRARTVRGTPPLPRKLSSRHVAGDPANVRAPDRDVEGLPATTTLSRRRRCTPRASPVGAPQLNSLVHPALHRVECRAGAPSLPDRLSPTTLLR